MHTRSLAARAHVAHGEKAAVKEHEDAEDRKEQPGAREADANFAVVVDAEAVGAHGWLSVLEQKPSKCLATCLCRRLSGWTGVTMNAQQRRSPRAAPRCCRRAWQGFHVADDAIAAASSPVGAVGTTAKRAHAKAQSRRVAVVVKAVAPRRTDSVC